MKKLLLVNPYIVGNPIKSRDMFFGREDDFAHVVKKIGDGRSNQILVLCGDRRSGKTSILFQILGGRLGEAFLPVLIDMQMLAGVRGDADFFRAILQVGCASLCQDGFTVEALEAAAGGQGVERLFEAFLSRIQERAPGRIVLFLLDEYELIEAKIRDGSLSESTIHYLAGLLESPYRVSFIFTGSTNLEDRRVEIWKSLLGKSIYRKISYLSRGDTARLVTEPVRESVSWPAELVEAIFRLTGGQPFYTQVICQNMVDLLMEEQKSDPQPADLERIVRDIVDNPLPQMIYSWNSLAEWSQVILASLASGLPDPGAWAGSRTVHRFLLRSRIVLPFKRERINVLLEEAYHKELLEKDDQEAYRFRMDLFRRWIGREHSIWKVAREAGLEFRKGGRRLALAAAIAVPLAVLAVLGWFLLVPRSPPGAPAGTELKDITFRANRGPFILKVDESLNLTSEGQADVRAITVRQLARGTHSFVATPREGSPVARRAEFVNDGQVIDIEFAAVTAKPRGTAPSGAASAPVQPETAALAPPAAVGGAADKAGGPAQAMNGGISEAPAAPPAEVPNQGDLVVSTTPSDAAVSLDGTATGKRTPFVEKVAGGPHVIVLTLEGHRAVRIAVTVEPGQQLRKEVVLEQAWAEIAFDVRPMAEVFLDGSHILDTPYARPYKVRAGNHVVRIRNEALRVDETIPVTLAEGEKTTITRVLK